MKRGLVLALIVVLLFGVRLYVNITSHTFADSESYYVLRQAQMIRMSGSPLFYDPLSFGGKRTPLIPGYYYLIAGASFLGEFVAFKLFPALIPALIGVASYLIAFQLCKEWRISALSGLFAGLVPAFVSVSTNTLTNHSAQLVLLMFSLYYLIRLERTKRALPGLLVSSILLSVMGSLGVALVIIVWGYAALIMLQGLRLQNKSLDFMLFITFFNVVINHLVFAPATLESGIFGVLGAKLSFRALNWIALIGGVNLFLLVLGVLGVYWGVKHGAKQRELSLLMVACVVIILLWGIHSVGLLILLSVLGIVLSITASISLSVFLNYAKKLRLPSAKAIIGLSFVVLIVLPVIVLGVYTAITQPSVPYGEIQALKWLRTRNTGTVLAPADAGHLVTFFANAKNIADTNPQNVRHLQLRLEDIKSAYKAQYETQAIGIFDKYGVTHILLSPRIKAKYNITQLSYVKDDKCFDLVYNDEAQIYLVKCNLS